MREQIIARGIAVSPPHSRSYRGLLFIPMFGPLTTMVLTLIFGWHPLNWDVVGTHHTWVMCCSVILSCSFAAFMVWLLLVVKEASQFVADRREK
jgi:hypothetical protein